MERHGGPRHGLARLGTALHGWGTSLCVVMCAFLFCLFACFVAWLLACLLAGVLVCDLACFVDLCCVILCSLLDCLFVVCLLVCVFFVRLCVSLFRVIGMFFVCLLVRLLICWCVCVLVCGFACQLASLFACLLDCFFVCLLVCIRLLASLDCFVCLHAFCCSFLISLNQFPCFCIISHYLKYVLSVVNMSYSMCIFFFLPNTESYFQVPINIVPISTAKYLFKVLDKSYLVIDTSFQFDPFRSMTEASLLDYLELQIRNGFEFPVHPVWAVRDPGWFTIFQRVTQSGRSKFFPSRVLDAVADLHGKFPNGFPRHCARSFPLKEFIDLTVDIPFEFGVKEEVEEEEDDDKEKEFDVKEEVKEEQFDDKEDDDMEDDDEEGEDGEAGHQILAAVAPPNVKQVANGQVCKSAHLSHLAKPSFPTRMSPARVANRASSAPPSSGRSRSGRFASQWSDIQLAALKQAMEEVEEISSKLLNSGNLNQFAEVELRFRHKCPELSMHSTTLRTKYNAFNDLKHQKPRQIDF